MGEGEKDSEGETIKVFRVNEHDWWAGESLESIKPAYRDETGYDPDSDDGGFEDPYELTTEQMTAHLMLEFDEEFEADHQPEDRTPTFQEYLDLLIRKGRKFPRLFASTEW